jgi:uncharacterized membrane-anchored protein YhcB (DUF1043 family)
MLFLAGLFLGTFIGVLIAGLCYAARENSRVRTSPDSAEDRLEAIRLQASSMS